MPDVLTHLLIGVSLVILIRPKGSRAEQMLIIVGALLPDVERPVTWVLNAAGLDWIGLTSATHSIVGVIVLSYVAAACFVLDGVTFRGKFALVFAGCVSHLLLDLVMYPWIEYGLYLFYPIKLAFSFHLVWPDYWFYPFVGVICVLFALLVYYLGVLAKALICKLNFQKNYQLKKNCIVF